MTVRLRAHHLLCALTYAGKGYSDAFVANYDQVARRLSDGEDILVVNGPDDICAPLLGDPNAHCNEQSVIDRDRQAAEDIGKLLGQTPEAGSYVHLTPARLAALRAAFSSGVTRKACTGCEWAELCDTIAASDFDATRLQISDLC